MLYDGKGYNLQTIHNNALAMQFVRIGVSIMYCSYTILSHDWARHFLGIIVG